jgi:hypothetical protein
MVMRRAALLLALPALAACQPQAGPIAGFGAPRGAAEEAALQYVAARDPVVDPAPVAACLAQNATAEEARLMAAGGAIGETVAQIVRRRSTQDCFAAAGVPDFGLDLLVT